MGRVGLALKLLTSILKTSIREKEAWNILYVVGKGLCTAATENDDIYLKQTNNPALGRKRL